MKRFYFNYTDISNKYYDPLWQPSIFLGYELKDISVIARLINYFVNHSSFSFFPNSGLPYKRSKGHTGYDYKILFKVLLYSILQGISLSKMISFMDTPDFLYLLSGFNRHQKRQRFRHFPKQRVFGKLLKIVDEHIDEIFDDALSFIQHEGVELDESILFVDGTVIEARNNLYKVANKTNIDKVLNKYGKVLIDVNSTVEERVKAIDNINKEKKKLEKLAKLGRKSYGLVDEDSQYMRGKKKNILAGYNVQLVEEHNFGLVVFCFISNKNPDSEAFLAMVNPLLNKYRPKNIVFDVGYGNPTVIEKLMNEKVEPIVFALKIQNAKDGEIINEYSFELSEDDQTMICPQGRTLVIKKQHPDRITYQSKNCANCPIATKCLGKRRKNKTLSVNLDKYKSAKKVSVYMQDEKVRLIYKERAHIGEMPNSYLKQVLGEKSDMYGEIRNGTMVKLTILRLRGIFVKLHMLLLLLHVKIVFSTLLLMSYYWIFLFLCVQIGGIIIIFLYI
jgi:transposase